MIDVRYYEADVPYWADSAMTVEVEAQPVFTLYLKAVNFGTRRFYLGLDMHNSVSAAMLRKCKTVFAEATEGFELEALVDKEDKKAQKFCTFFGFKRIPNYEVDKHFVYERLDEWRL